MGKVSSTHNDILEYILSQPHGIWISGEAISAMFGVTRAAVSRHILSCREEGHVIESAPRKGYRLVCPADPWADESFPKTITTKVLGKKGWIWERTTNSTNTVAALEAVNGAKEGLVVIARRQNQGRGTHGKTWHHLPGTLNFSVLVKPKKQDANVLLGLAQEVCIESIRQVCNVQAIPKKPNDIMLNGKKTAGILIETMLYNGEPQWSVIGIGMNINTPAEDIPDELSDKVTSIYAETKAPCSITAMLKVILENMENRLFALKSKYRNLPE